MRKNLFIILGIVLIILGAAVSYFAGFDLAEVTGFAVSMFGAGVAASGFWSKRKKTGALSVITLACIAGGSFILGFGGFVESTVTTIIASVAGIAAIIAGIVTGVISGKEAKTS